jgi:hypothetical protein
MDQPVSKYEVVCALLGIEPDPELVTGDTLPSANPVHSDADRLKRDAEILWPKGDVIKSEPVKGELPVTPLTVRLRFPTWEARHAFLSEWDTPQYSIRAVDLDGEWPDEDEPSPVPPVESEARGSLLDSCVLTQKLQAAEATIANLRERIQIRNEAVENLLAQVNFAESEDAKLRQRLTQAEADEIYELNRVKVQQALADGEKILSLMASLAESQGEVSALKSLLEIERGHRKNDLEF